jgi:transcriptional regulator GlxA family with amidase domain
MRHVRFRIRIFAFLRFFYQWASGASSTIENFVFDGFLSSDVAAPIEVFGAATQKSWFSSYKVVPISATKSNNITSEEGLKLVADKTICDNLMLDVLVAPRAI